MELTVAGHAVRVVRIDAVEGEPTRRVQVAFPGVGTRVPRAHQLTLHDAQGHHMCVLRLGKCRQSHAYA
eukprot:54463-Eustigmatos_ZCMA.PRE.1